MVIIKKSIGMPTKRSIIKNSIVNNQEINWNAHQKIISV